MPVDHSRHRLSLSVWLTAAVLAVMIAATGSSVAAVPVTAARVSKHPCATVGATPKVVKRIFGPGASAADESAYPPPRCEIEAAKGSAVPSECQEPSSTCTNTDVLLSPAGAFATEVANQVAELDKEGHARKLAVKGAGVGAVLVVANHYGGLTNPALFLKAGAYTVEIVGPFAGVAYNNAVYTQWKALARVIHAHLG